ncbi:MAG: hypothetical protein WDN44_07485 [Sphingomonas sp.]
MPSARLERAFVEHIDCLSYRFDAWRLGLQSAQLKAMRAETDTGFGRGGLLIGAYGWVEKLAPRAGSLEPFTPPPAVAAALGLAGPAPVVRDTANLGHIHAPSLDQAVTAAILRNGHHANATPDQPGLLAVDLSSERVRLAEQVLEGVRNGQSLGALLGYRLERLLHDEARALSRSADLRAARRLSARRQPQPVDARRQPRPYHRGRGAQRPSMGSPSRATSTIPRPRPTPMAWTGCRRFPSSPVPGCPAPRRSAR